MPQRIDLMSSPPQRKNPEDYKEKQRIYQRKRNAIQRKIYEDNFLTILPTSTFIDVYGYRKLRFGSIEIYEHRHLLSKQLGELLGNDVEVHHKNGDRKDNRIENLEIIPKYPHKSSHRLIDELHKKDQEITKLKYLLQQKEMTYV